MKKKLIFLSLALLGTSGLIMGMESESESANSSLKCTVPSREEARAVAQNAASDIEEVASKIRNWVTREEQNRSGYEDLTEIKRLFRNVDPNTKVGQFKEPFLILATRGAGGPSPKLIEVLLSISDIDVNATDISERTPLHFAAMAGYNEIVEQLLIAGANPLLKDTLGQTARESAVRDLQTAYSIQNMPERYRRTLQLLDSAEIEANHPGLPEAYVGGRQLS